MKLVTPLQKKIVKLRALTRAVRNPEARDVNSDLTQSVTELGLHAYLIDEVVDELLAQKETKS